MNPKAIDARADLITPLHPTEQPMFDDSVMEVICERNNLIKAYKKVCQNKGAPGGEVLDQQSNDVLNEKMVKHHLIIGKHNAKDSLILTP